MANLLGCTAFLYAAHLLHIRSRKRLEISSLYQPLSTHTYRDAQGRQHSFEPSSPSTPSQHTRQTTGRTHGPYRHQRQGSSVWDEESEAGGQESVEDVSRELSKADVPDRTVFDIGEEDEEQAETDDQRTEPRDIV